MDKILTSYLKREITETQLVHKLGLTNTQLIYIKQELDNYTFGESTLEATINRIKELI